MPAVAGCKPQALAPRSACRDPRRAHPWSRRRGHKCAIQTPLLMVVSAYPRLSLTPMRARRPLGILYPAEQKHLNACHETFRHHKIYKSIYLRKRRPRRPLSGHVGPWRASHETGLCSVVSIDRFLICSAISKSHRANFACDIRRVLAFTKGRTPSRYEPERR